MIKNVLDTYFGDANLDGRFNADDLIEAFQSGLYDHPQPGSAHWAAGDWNGDGSFNADDLIAAFSDGGYDLPASTSTDAADQLGETDLELLAASLLGRNSSKASTRS